MSHLRRSFSVLLLQLFTKLEIFLGVFCALSLKANLYRTTKIFQRKKSLQNGMNFLRNLLRQWTRLNPRTTRNFCWRILNALAQRRPRRKRCLNSKAVKKQPLMNRYRLIKLTSTGPASQLDLLWDLSRVPQGKCFAMLKKTTTIYTSVLLNKNYFFRSSNNPTSESSLEQVSYQVVSQPL